MFMNKWVIVSLLLVLLTAGCIEERVPEVATTTTTEMPTTTIETTTTLEEPILTTTTTISKRCRFLNFQIKSHAYRDDKLTLYFNNIGSNEINGFDVYLYFTNKTSVESFTDQAIPYHVVMKYVLGVGPGLDNVTVVDSECGKSYFVNV
jgi:hypothetical protein